MKRTVVFSLFLSFVFLCLRFLVFTFPRLPPCVLVILCVSVFPWFLLAVLSSHVPPLCASWLTWHFLPFCFLSFEKPHQFVLCDYLSPPQCGAPVLIYLPILLCFLSTRLLRSLPDCLMFLFKHFSSSLCPLPFFVVFGYICLLAFGSLPTLSAGDKCLNSLPTVALLVHHQLSV